ncbi:MAG: hypothetical protein JWP31_404 [Aeromicrobium sp.]|nr:hypothetical protein [Aeromicrobium sp.]
MSRPRLVGIIVGIAVLSGVLGAWAGRSSNDSTEPRSRPDAVAVGFLQDMIVHHAQGIELAQIVVDDSDPAIASVANLVLQGQAQELGEMKAYLTVWGEPLVASGASMAWMPGHHHGQMPGLATTQQLDALRSSRGAARDALFLDLMVEHHRGAVEMAAAGARTDQKVVRSLAARIEFDQQEEISRMLQLKASLPR